MQPLKRWFWRKVSREKRAKILFIIILCLLVYVLYVLASNPFKKFVSTFQGGASTETNSTETTDSSGLNQFNPPQEQETTGFITNLLNQLFPQNTEQSVLEVEAAETGETPKSEQKTVNGNLTITFLDIGQGDCTLITQGDESIMVDTGYYLKKEECESALYERQISELSALVLTHPDADHIGSADALVENFYIDEVLMPDKESDTTVYEINMQAFEQTGTPYEYIKAGDQFYLGDARIYFFGPVTIPEDPEDTNNASLMMKIEFGDTAFLLIGDAEIEEEESAVLWAAQNGLDLSCNVFKCGHHGAANSLYEPLYKAAGADYYIISCGSDNEYGHPSKKVIDYIDKTGGTYYLTESRDGIEGKGDITVTSDGSRLKWTFRNTAKPKTDSNAPLQEAA